MRDKVRDACHDRPNNYMNSDDTNPLVLTIEKEDLVLEWNQHSFSTTSVGQLRFESTHSHSFHR